MSWKNRGPGVYTREPQTPRFKKPEVSDPAPTCTITLEAPGVAGAFGAEAMDIDGQTASITASADPPQYSASAVTGLEIGAFTGRRGIEHHNESTAGWQYSARGLINDPPSVDAVWRWRPGSNEWRVIIGGDQKAAVSGAHDDLTGVVLGEDGTVEFWRENALVAIEPAFSQGDTVKPFAITNGGGEGDFTSTTFITDDSRQQTLDSALDWCGNEI